MEFQDINMKENELNLEKKIEAVLFYLAEPTKVDFLAKTLEVKKDELLESLKNLEISLKERGLRLVLNDGEVTLVTAPELGSLIEKIIKEERERDLGRAGIETLAIIAYKGPITKKEIEYIRGVNSQYALRNLLLRGLIERKSSKDDERMIVYTITLDTLRFLGLSNISDLPEYLELQKQLEIVEETETPEENNG